VDYSLPGLPKGYDMPDNGKEAKPMTCCGALEHLEKEGYPFERPMRIHRKTGKVTFDTWAVQVHKRLASGRLSRSKKQPVHVVLNFCPFCGVDIRDIYEPETEPKP
jgi:hypothetical protein